MNRVRPPSGDRQPIPGINPWEPDQVVNIRGCDNDLIARLGRDDGFRREDRVPVEALVGVGGQAALADIEPIAPRRYP